jgi:uncharacterized membrane protein (Fun14 family)
MNIQNVFMTETLKELGFGAGIGFLLGFTIKRALKIMIFFIGLYFLSLLWLADNGLITLNLSAMERFLTNTFESFTAFTKTAVKALAFMSSFAVGFAVGLKV